MQFIRLAFEWLHVSFRVIRMELHREKWDDFMEGW